MIRYDDHTPATRPTSDAQDAVLSALADEVVAVRAERRVEITAAALARIASRPNSAKTALGCPSLAQAVDLALRSNA